MGFGTSLGSSLGRYPGDGEDGALGRLHHRLIGSLNALGERARQIKAVGGFLPLHILGEAAEQQRSNDAGIAPSPPQQRSSGNLRDLAGGDVIPSLGKLLGRIAQGQRHVGAGVAVGHGEHVEIVDCLLMLVNIGGGADKHGLQLCTADKFFQVCCTSGMGTVPIEIIRSVHADQSTLMESI